MHRAPTNRKYMVSGTFNSPKRGTFHLSVALLFAIGRDVVLSLGGWAPRLHTEFHELHATLVRRSQFRDSCTGLSPYIVRLSRLFHYSFLYMFGARNPGPKTGLGYSAFARRY